MPNDEGEYCPFSEKGEDCPKEWTSLLKDSLLKDKKKLLAPNDEEDDCPN